MKHIGKLIICAALSAFAASAATVGFEDIFGLVGSDTAGSLLLSGAPETVVAFGMHRDGATFYSDPAANGDGLYHAAVTGIPTDSTPEPGTLALIGLGLVAIAKRGGND